MSRESLERKISREEISQEYDLEKLLGYTPSARQKEIFVNLILDKMIERTTNGKDINSKKFKAYTKEYAERKGVPRSSVDLVLSGDMLNTIKEKKTGKVKISIADNELDKAYGHIKGMEGHPTIEKGKVRDFFGFKSKRQINDVLKEVDSLKDVNAQPTENVVDLVELRKQIRSLSITTTGLGQDGDS